ncbi:MAG: sensor domain-containing diguanylate cyclase [Moraxellaceae bacterium]|nr:MAG: sensor domain-containing diguanylate cyclase [Moraxellaceae bacterium]
MSKEYPQAASASENIQPPKLHGFRPLQFYALLGACLWALCTLLITRHVIAAKLAKDLLNEEKFLVKEVRYVLTAVEQTMHQAEQLSKTLSFDRSIINLAKNANLSAVNSATLDATARAQYVLALPGASAVNGLFAQLAQHVEMDQILLQDKNGYCVGSSRSDQKDGCIGVSYFTRDYFQAARTFGSGRQFAVGRLVPTPSFFFSTAIKDADNFAGVVVVRQTVKQIINILEHQNLTVAMTEKNGIVLSSNRKDMLFQQIAAYGEQMPPQADIQRIFQSDSISALPITLLESPKPELKLILFEGKRYMMLRSATAAEDFYIYVLSPVDALFLAEQKTWGLAVIVLALGLLIILLIERNINYAQHRSAHVNALSAANISLAHASSELYFLSVTDVLTGIANRRFFTQRLEEEIDRRLRGPAANQNAAGTLALLAIDIDFFKKINDTYGHPAGDQAICTLANICKHTIRPYDVLGRIGGEEFAVLLNDTNAQQACEIAERIRTLCATTGVYYENCSFNQTCSIGVALYASGERAEHLLSHADRALYAAKHQGRNCVHVFSAEHT